jgi:hypothetical protein
LAVVEQLGRQSDGPSELESCAQLDPLGHAALAEHACEQTPGLEKQLLPEPQSPCALHADPIWGGGSDEQAEMTTSAAIAARMGSLLGTPDYHRVPGSTQHAISRL